MGIAAWAWLAAAMPAWAQPAGPPVYYVSPHGDDRRTGRSPGEAWRTLGRVQQAFEEGALASGGEVRLARGGAFTGGLAIASLTLAPPAALAISAYGEGEPPVITGLVPLREWGSLGGGRWRAICRECTAAPSILARDGTALPLARYPNLDEADHGYLYYESAGDRTSITDEDLPPEPNWTGAEAVVRSAAWILDRLPVASHQGRTLTFAVPATYPIPRGYGYFLQNHPAALDLDGEWTFDPGSRTITVVLADTTPANHEFAVSVTDTLIAVSASRGVTIDGVRLVGARRANLEIRQSARIRIRGIESLEAGEVGVRCLDCRDLLLEDSAIGGAMNHGLDVFNCTDCVVERNRISDIATVAGMGRSGNGQYNGVRFGGVNAVFRRNQVSRTGYLGIDVRGAAAILENEVSEFNLVKTDGGGIYTWGNRSVEIAGNVVRDGAGSRAAVPWNSPATHGIYIDDQSEDVRVRGNTVVSVASNGIYLHNTRAVSVERNTVVDAGESQIAYIDDNLGSYQVTETEVRGNLFVSMQPVALLARASTTGGAAFFSSLGTMAGNRYCSPFGEAVFGSSVAGQPRLFLEQWQLLTGADADAQLCPVRYAAYRVMEATGPDRVENGRFDSGLRGWFGWPGDSLEAAWDNGRLRLRHTGSAPIVHYDTSAGVIEAGKFYRVRFEAHSSRPARLLRVYLRSWDPDYRYLGAPADLPLGSEPRAYDLVIPATQSENRSLLIFELANASQEVWLDNVRLEPVEAEAAERAGLVRVEINPSAEPRRLTLEADFRDADGRLLPAGSAIEVGPYGSLVLLRAQDAANLSPVSASHCRNRAISFFRSARYRLLCARFTCSYGSSFKSNRSRDWRRSSW